MEVAGLTYTDQVFIPSRNRVFEALLGKYPWIGYLASKLLGTGYRFGVQMLEEGDIKEEWTLTEGEGMITDYERGIKNLKFILFGLQLKLVFKIEKRVLERWVAEEKDLIRHPLLKSLKYVPKILLGTRLYNKDQ